MGRKAWDVKGMDVKAWDVKAWPNPGFLRADIMPGPRQIRVSRHSRQGPRRSDRSPEAWAGDKPCDGP